MIAIVPALLRTPEDVGELTSTLTSIPVDVVSRCVVAWKGLRPELDAAPRGREYTLVEGDMSTTKWGSIEQGLREVEVGSTERVLLIDADDPFEAASLREFCLHAQATTADCVVGRRDRVILVAQDQQTPMTRLYIEVFSNTLLLAKLGTLTNGPDIQSGLYALPADLLRGVNLSGVKSYGGELTLYHDLVKSGARVEEKVTRTHEVLESSYLSQDIFRAILELPLFSAVTSEDLQRAVEEGARLYAEWLPSGGEASYREEIRALLARR